MSKSSLKPYVLVIPADYDPARVPETPEHPVVVVTPRARAAGYPFLRHESHVTLLTRVYGVHPSGPLAVVGPANGGVFRAAGEGGVGTVETATLSLALADLEAVPAWTYRGFRAYATPYGFALRVPENTPHHEYGSLYVRPNGWLPSTQAPSDATADDPAMIGTYSPEPLAETAIDLWINVTKGAIPTAAGCIWDIVRANPVDQFRALWAARMGPGLHAIAQVADLQAKP